MATRLLSALAMTATHLVLGNRHASTACAAHSAAADVDLLLLAMKFLVARDSNDTGSLRALVVPLAAQDLVPLTSPVAELRANKAAQVVTVYYDGDENAVERYHFREGMVQRIDRLPAVISAVDGTADRDRRHNLLQWLLRGVRFLHADVYLQWDVHEELLSDDITMFGAKGRPEVMALKKSFLDVKPAYQINSISAHGESRMIRADFVSLLPGKEGAGTEFLWFDEALEKVTAAHAVRHVV